MKWPYRVNASQVKHIYETRVKVRRQAPPPDPRPHLSFKTRAKVRRQAPSPRPLPLPPPTSFRPSPDQPLSSPFPIHSYFRLKCALACCPWQAWLRVHPTTNQNLSQAVTSGWMPTPTPRFCRMFAYFQPQIKIMQSRPSLKRNDGDALT